MIYFLRFSLYNVSSYCSFTVVSPILAIVYWRIVKSILISILIQLCELQRIWAIDHLWGLTEKCLKVSVLTYNYVLKILPCCIVIGGRDFYNSSISGKGLNID